MTTPDNFNAQTAQRYGITVHDAHSIIRIIEQTIEDGDSADEAMWSIDDDGLNADGCASTPDVVRWVARQLGYTFGQG
jgi:hypothetical protein